MRWNDFAIALGGELSRLPEDGVLNLGERQPEHPLNFGFLAEDGGLIGDLGPFPSRSAFARLTGSLSARRRADRARWAEFGQRLSAAGWQAPGSEGSPSRRWDVRSRADRAECTALATEVVRVCTGELRLSQPADLSYNAFQDGDQYRELHLDSLGLLRD